MIPLGPDIRHGIIWLFVVVAASTAFAQTSEIAAPAASTAGAPQTSAPSKGTEQTDPFADLSGASPAAQTQRETEWVQKFLGDNFGFKKEIMSQFDTDAGGSNASRQSIGFEVLKRFSNSTSTIASFDFQGRLVRRDGYNPVANDMEGATRPGWAFEYHNVYLDLYNILNPFLDDNSRARAIGRVNFRVGRFYVPFGLNLQTDTHGTFLQLSNGDDFGFERDWYAGFWGAVNKHLNYDAYYLVGSGYDLKFKGQSGLGALRISLSNKYSSEYGLEGGISVIGGERLVSPGGTMALGEASPTTLAAPLLPLKTQRIGIDARWRRTAPHGLVTFTTELSGGRDAANPVTMQLGQLEYLHASRRWSIATQFRNFDEASVGRNSALIGEFTWYFRNDVANTNAHWIALAIERQLHSFTGKPGTILALQYYFYL
ncbi:MAG TPA: hypothetical protein VF146_01860 [Bryobacteraceae bacterium]